MLRWTITLLFAACSQYLSAAQKVAISSSGVDEIVVIDKASGTIESRYKIDKGGECNSIYVDPKGNLLYSYKQGARMVDASGKMLWDYKVEQGCELQSVAPIKKGYALAVCGTPSRIVEVDAKGNLISEICFDIDAKSVHGQFRQIMPMPDGTYLVPLMSRGEIIRINKKGEQTTSPLKVKGNLFSVAVAPNGNYVVSAGDTHSAVEIDPRNGNVVREISNIEGVTLAFVAQTILRPDGSMLIANWLGHFKEDKTGIPHIIELDPDGKVVSKYSNDEHQRGASSIFEFNK